MTSTSEPIAIVIVGGGPVGLSIARELAHHGVASTVIEPRDAVSMTRPRAKTTSARTMELFRRWSLADVIRDRAPIPVDWSSDIVFCTAAAGNEIARFTNVLGLDLQGSDLAAEPGQQVGQPVVEQVLRDALAESPLVTLLWGSRAIGVTDQGRNARVEVMDRDGGTRMLTAAYVVGADGPRSIVRAAMGAKYVGADAGRPNLSVVFRSHQLKSLIHDRAVHRWVLNPAAPGVVGPMDLQDEWWAIATGRPVDDQDADPVAIVRALVGADIDVEVLGTDPWQARSLLADRYRSGRLFLAGDAAHQNPPWGGHGFNTGVGDAVNLGWKLAAVTAGWAPESLLESYEAERRPIAQQTIRIAANNTKSLPTDLADPRLFASDTEFEAARPRAAAAIQLAKRSEFYALGLTLGYGYGERASEQTSDQSDYRPVAAAGNRLPHAWLAPGDSLYDHLGSEFTLLADETHAAALARAAMDRGVPITWLGPDVFDTVSAYGAEIVLIRPDQHIAWIGDLVDLGDPDDVVAAAVRGFAAPTDQRAAAPAEAAVGAR